MAALVLVIASPGVVAAWSNYSFSGTEETHLLTLINQWRASNGLAALSMDSTLQSVARNRSKDMYDRDYFSHNIPPDGHTVFNVLQSMGYCYKSAGENIGWNNYPDDQTTSVLFNGWKGSSAHNANMLGSYKVVGIGIFKGDGRDAGSGPFSVDTAAYPVHVFTAVFAYPCSASPSPTPKPTPTPTPKPTATPRPTPTPTPRPTPTPTSTPRPTPTPTSHPTPTPTQHSTPTPTPTDTPDVTPNPTPSAFPSFDSPTPSDEVSPSPSDEPSAEPSPEPTFEASFDAGPPATDVPSLDSNDPNGGISDGFGLQVLEPLPSQDLLDAIVAGVASTFFGH